MRNALLTYGDFVLVAGVTAILAIVLPMLYVINAGVVTTKWVGRFFSNNG